MWDSKPSFGDSWTVKEEWREKDILAFSLQPKPKRTFTIHQAIFWLLVLNVILNATWVILVLVILQVVTKGS